MVLDTNDQIRSESKYGVRLYRVRRSKASLFGYGYMAIHTAPPRTSGKGRTMALEDSAGGGSERLKDDTLKYI